MLPVDHHSTAARRRPDSQVVVGAPVVVVSASVVVGAWAVVGAAVVVGSAEVWPSGGGAGSVSSDIP